MESHKDPSRIAPMTLISLVWCALSVLVEAKNCGALNPLGNAPDNDGPGWDPVLLPQVHGLGMITLGNVDSRWVEKSMVSAVRVHTKHIARTTEQMLAVS